MNPSAPSSFLKPGIHSYNWKRYEPLAARPSSLATFIRALLVICGIGALGYYAFTLADEKVYQAYGNWAFDQQIAGKTSTSFADYIRAKTPFGFFAGPSESHVSPTAENAATAAARPVDGSIIGRVAIGRLNLSAVVRQGVDDKTLSEAVGHVPSTALPGQPGNFAIAAHRDTLFRALKDIKKDDLISFQSASGTFTYKVAATKIVRPTDVSVLRADGGGLIKNNGDEQPEKLLTMITCYPFYYVGSAPKRFIVEAKLVPPNGDGLASSTADGMVK